MQNNASACKKNENNRKQKNENAIKIKKLNIIKYKYLRLQWIVLQDFSDRAIINIKIIWLQRKCII